MRSLAGMIGATANPECVRAMLAAMPHRGTRVALRTRLDACLATAGDSEPHPTETAGGLLVMIDGLAQPGNVHSSSEDQLESVSPLAERVAGWRGSFAVAASIGNTVWLARDRFGRRPLYYWLSADRRQCVYASELKGVLQSALFAPSIDPESLADALVLSHPIGSRTLLDGVRSVEPGQIVRLSIINGDIEVTCSALRAPERAATAEPTDDEASRAVAEALRQGVSLLARPHGAVGFALSGGLDSAVLGALLVDLRDAGEIARVCSLTVRTAEPSDDADISRKLASAWGFSHTDVEIDDEYLLRHAAACVSAREIASIAGVTLHALGRQLTTHGVTCCMNGIGAAEVFGERNTFLDWPGQCTRVRSRVAQIHEAGLSLSAAGGAAVEALLSASSYTEYLLEGENEMRAGEWHRRVAESMGATWGLEALMPYYDDALTELMQGISRDVRRSWTAIADKFLLKRTALALYGESLAVPVLRGKSAMSEAALRPLHALRAVVDRRMPDSYLRAHPFGAAVRDKTGLLLIDLFSHVFVTRRGAALDVPVDEFLDAMAPVRARHGHERVTNST